MTEQNSPQTPDATPAEATVVEPKFLSRLTTKYPRITRALAIGGSLVAIAAVATVVNTTNKNRNHLNAAADSAKDALGELSNAVSPTSETTDA